jgi:hypothetical protein
MATMQPTEERVNARRISPMVPWGLLAGGALFFIGGSMHPHDDPPDVTVKEHLRLMFDDPAWYPSHVVLLVGVSLIAVALVALVRSRALAGAPRAQLIGAIAAGSSVLGALGMLLHLVAATEADRIAAGQSTPIIDVQIVVETTTVPAFGFSIAATAVLAVVGGVGYGLAGATFAFTDALDFLFPAAGGIGLWAIAAGLGLHLRARSTRTLDLQTA